MISDFENIFMCLLAICLFSLGKHIFSFTAHLNFFILSCIIYLYIFDINPLLAMKINFFRV